MGALAVAAPMGARAFALLMAAELALAVGWGGQTAGAWFGGLWRAPHL